MTATQELWSAMTSEGVWVPSVLALIGFAVFAPEQFIGCLLVVCRLIGWAIRWHPWASTLAVSVLYLAVVVSERLAYVGAALTLVGLLAWWALDDASFERFVGRRLRSAWRVEVVYRRRWRRAMRLFAMSARIDGLEVVPTSGTGTGAKVEERPDLIRVVSHRNFDRVLIRQRMGHELAHWDLRSAALAETFRVQSCQPGPVLNRRNGNLKPGYVWLNCRTRETLRDTIPPLSPVPVEPLDLSAVPVGLTEYGDVLTLPLSGVGHVLIGGEPRSGKSALIWQILHSLGPAIAAGLVEIWAIDPKGGMELTAGAPMYRQYAYPSLIDGEVTAASMVGMVELLEDAARFVVQRSDRMREAGQRKHSPSLVNPAVILIVDEFAFFTKYLPIPELRRRAQLATGVILSQGPAPGVTLLAALQDVRKEAVPDRDLFSTRVAMRLPEASQTDLILGDGAYKRGAHCDRIPRNLRGIGYVLGEIYAEPIRFRGGYLDDGDIARTASLYPAPPPIDFIDTTAVEVVDDSEGVAA